MTPRGCCLFYLEVFDKLTRISLLDCGLYVLPLPLLNVEINSDRLI